MSIPKVEVYRVDDWAGLYEDGHLVYEGHSIPDREFLALMRDHGIATHDEFIDRPEADAVAYTGRMPLTVRELEQIRADFRLRKDTRSADT